MNRVILCCGGREFSDRAFVFRSLDAVRLAWGDFAVLHGGARGADTLSKEWGNFHGLPVFACDANWPFYRNKAGGVRNSWMLDYLAPCYGVAFPGGTGTADMISKLRVACIDVWLPAEDRMAP